MDEAALAWLLTDAGRRLLATVGEVRAAAPAGPGRDLHLAAAVRRLERDPARAAAALTPVELRARAVTKFGADAARMYFTRDALEQATHPVVAAHRAARLAAALAAASVVDLGCGLGSDLAAFRYAGLAATGIDSDPLRVALARANLAALGLPGPVDRSDATEVHLGAYDAAYADPARRSARGREFGPDGWTPPWPFVVGLLTGSSPRPARHGVVKVAPGIPHDVVPLGCEAEWVGLAGEVKEAALWSPGLATSRRRATVLGVSAGAPASGTALPGVPPPHATLTEADDPWEGRERPVRGVGQFLYEPEGAVIRAGLVTAVAALVGGGLVDPHGAYVTGDEASRTPYARCFRVLEEVPYRERPLRQALRARGIGRLTIMKRGVDVVPDQLRRRLALRGDAEGVLVLTRTPTGAAAYLVAPLGPDSP